MRSTKCQLSTPSSPVVSQATAAWHHLKTDISGVHLSWGSSYCISPALGLHLHYASQDEWLNTTTPSVQSLGLESAVILVPHSRKTNFCYTHFKPEEKLWQSHSRQTHPRAGQTTVHLPLRGLWVSKQMICHKASKELRFWAQDLKNSPIVPLSPLQTCPGLPNGSVPPVRS